LDAAKSSAFTYRQYSRSRAHTLFSATVDRGK
jgi:hypothetical protein